MRAVEERPDGRAEAKIESSRAMPVCGGGSGAGADASGGTGAFFVVAELSPPSAANKSWIVLGC